MKRLFTILCSLLVTFAFAYVTMAVEPKVQKAPPVKKQGKTAPKKQIKTEDNKNTDQQSTEQKEEKKETKDSKKGKKIEKKEEQKKSDDKK